MAFKMKSPLPLLGIIKAVAKAGRQQKKDLKKAKKAAKLEQKARFKRGNITRKRFKDIKKEIKRYKDY